ncbi:MAG: flavodoxin-dependent (E)-4-hydroxy-3-methylbut-2-enyl-diphosphate synthase, partial [Duncaniella sp.]|nr:flavodoxin-dependent (E)-4-hydroxy-3-methylbut-2-enyl-diphosphate synthase [Duncaniella sp.]
MNRIKGNEWHRRATWPVKVGNVIIGGDAPIVLQSMTTTSTNDTEGSVAQIGRIVAAGGQIVRLTTQGVREAENLTAIKEGVVGQGVDVPLVADVHFNPRAAFAAASRVEKVRINPGNFVDPGRTFKKIDYTDEEYQAELEKIREALVPLLDVCKENGTALRIGVNHGSLSDRIMSRYGDTPAGMVESAMEFLRVCVAENFRDVVISIKASNVLVMTETVRRLVKA